MIAERAATGAVSQRKILGPMEQIFSPMIPASSAFSDAPIPRQNEHTNEVRKVDYYRCFFLCRRINTHNKAAAIRTVKTDRGRVKCEATELF